MAGKIEVCLVIQALRMEGSQQSEPGVRVSCMGHADVEASDIPAIEASGEQGRIRQLATESAAALPQFYLYFVPVERGGAVRDTKA